MTKQCRHNYNALNSLINIVQLEPCRKCQPQDYQNCPYNKYESVETDKQEVAA